ncbi:pseudouridine-5'-phosphate glycosidase, partial [Escherichia coli]|uniref:pseudouridine-5'-phosphate glycosidase n=4 Tax=Escherichia coli TaxID=562 RepID=UPI001F108CFC
HHAFSSGAGRTSDGNGSHASTLKSPSYTKSVSWQHYPFFCRTSPFDVSIRLDSASEIARAMAVKWQSGLNGGLVVANPIPEQFAMPEHTINAAIDQAVAEAEAQGVIGKESTPFLLARVAELTGGGSLKSNIQLVFNNAILASEIAKEYQRLAG